MRLCSTSFGLHRSCSIQAAIRLIIVVSIFLGAHLHICTARVLPEAGGSYYQNVSLEFKNSPYKVTRQIVVQNGANLTIQEGVQMFFDPGIGITVHGVLHAVGSRFLNITFAPRLTPALHDDEFPNLRLVDGPSTSKGRLEVYYAGRWRAACTKLTNWTSTDYSLACKTMGFGGGGFWRWYRRNNDTRPFVMPRPGCLSTDKSLLECSNMKKPVQLSENLCQGEDDLGLVCWGPPSFSGSESHWWGIQFIDAPWSLYPADDPHGIAAKRVSKSRLEFLSIDYAGFRGDTKNATASIYSRGVPPVLNYVNVLHSAGDGMRFFDAFGPVEITNSTVSHNRGHGIVVHNTTDGRLFVNQTRVQFNFGDGIQYSVRRGLYFQPLMGPTRRSTLNYYEPFRPDFNMCKLHKDTSRNYYPKLVEAFIENGTFLDQNIAAFPCYSTLNIPSNRPYTYTIQFLDVRNGNARTPRPSTNTTLVFCDTGPDCAHPVQTLPMFDGIFPPNIVTHNKGYGLWIGMKHSGAYRGIVQEPIRVVMRIHAQVKDQVIYGLNVSNSRVTDNLGKGIFVHQMRDRTVVNNVTIERNQHIAGLHIQGGVGDIWVNNTRLNFNLGDGMNVTYAGGSCVINGTSLSSNLMRGVTFHYNETIGPFMPLSQEILIKGRRSNSAETPTRINANAWGGIIVGNFCRNAYSNEYGRNLLGTRKVIVNYVELNANRYHPAFEYHSCQQATPTQTYLELTGSRCQSSTGFCFRIEPAVNAEISISDNRFFNNRRSVLLIRNRNHPQLAYLPARLRLVNNQFKHNSGGPWVVNVGLNENSPRQSGVMNGQNEIKHNKIINPYPHLKARNLPHAALVISSSNLKIQRNCFENGAGAAYEIATDLDEHAKIIDASENSWGLPTPEQFMPRVFDATKRYNLARFSLDPYATLCNSHNPQLTPFVRYVPPFRDPRDPHRLGGMVYEHVDLRKGRYSVVDDLHILPGARLNIEPGTVFQFEDSIGMLVQGQLLRMQNGNEEDFITFTKKDFKNPPVANIRLINDEGNVAPTEGRLEVLIDGEWGTICNRSWTVNLASMACLQLGMIADPEFRENWWYTPASAGDLPIVIDNIRCEELETDITRCRHDGQPENVALSCPDPSFVVGLRCVQPRWAGLRYTLLANPPSVTEQEYVHHIVIERAGLLDFVRPTMTAALQIDWNYHTFRQLIVRDNFWTGVDIVYNDLVKKPRILDSRFERNRRNGLRARSYGLTIERTVISHNENAGVRYNPILSQALQRDVVTWLQRDDLTENQIVTLPDLGVDKIELYDSSVAGRKFLVAKPNRPCGNAQTVSLLNPCAQRIEVSAVNIQSSSNARIGVNIVNRPSNTSDETLRIIDTVSGASWDIRKDLIDFPVVSTGNRIRIVYSRSYGPPALMVMLFYQDAYQYLDPFIHIRHSSITHNQYAVSTMHYSNFTHTDGSIINRYKKEQLWFQKIKFSHNKQAVIWVNGPLRDTSDTSPFAEIRYWLDNCSVTANNGSVIETHRDLYRSANMFHWRVYRSTFSHNDQSGFAIALPEPYRQDIIIDDENNFAINNNNNNNNNKIVPFLERGSNRFQASGPRIPNQDPRLRQKLLMHRFEFLENRLRNNKDFEFHLSGYAAWCNISANNFTHNHARPGRGLMRFTGMEKQLIMERNRFYMNKGEWVISWEIQSQMLLQDPDPNAVLPAEIIKNYFTENYYLSSSTEPMVDNRPRSFALGVRGLQMVNVSLNNFRNELLDFEMVVGLRGSTISRRAWLNATLNYWGVANGPDVAGRIFDFDDWNIYSIANYNPYMVTEEWVHRWTWDVSMAQTDSYDPESGKPVIYDLKGRLTQSLTLRRLRQKWTQPPYYYKPDRPYLITKDLTVMPGVTLTIEKGVELHLYPGVRILVLGTIVAEGTRLEPIRFLPINITELDQQRRDYFRLRDPTAGPYKVGQSHRIPSLADADFNNNDGFDKYDGHVGIPPLAGPTVVPSLRNRQIKTSYGNRQKRDAIYRKFPLLNRQDGFYQKFPVFLVGSGSKTSGWLEIYNRTTGEMVPICDRQFTRRNAAVVCRELGYDTPTENVYYWVAPRWDFNPRLRIVRAYSEPRQCFGDEPSLDQCNLRLNGDRSLWYCSDTLHFVFVHCGPQSTLNITRYPAHWGGITLSLARIEEYYDDATSSESGWSKYGTQQARQRQLFQPQQNPSIAPTKFSPQSGSKFVHVEIVGAGAPHNASDGSALELIFQSPFLKDVNITNSSMHGVSVIAPRGSVSLDAVNVTYNLGVGISVLTLNLRSDTNTHSQPLRIVNIPYNAYGLVDMCSVSKLVTVSKRLLLYYKYDSYPVNCVKMFQSVGGLQRLGFRFLQINLYNSHDDVGRPDTLEFYNSSLFSNNNRLLTLRHDSPSIASTVESDGPLLGVYLRANAADGKYGFIAEVITLPAAPELGAPEEVNLQRSRLEYNHRGALRYASMGERNQDINIAQCYVGHNGYHVWGNFTTSTAAMSLHLHNTLRLTFDSNQLWRNTGGLRLTAGSSTSVARLDGRIRNSGFSQNTYHPTLHLVGRDFQKMLIDNNYFGKNYVPYADVAFVDRMITNFSHNIFYNNTGTHIIDLTGYPRVQTEFQVFYRNLVYDNIALGHGYQFNQSYGYFARPEVPPRARRRRGIYRRLGSSKLSRSLNQLKSRQPRRLVPSLPVDNGFQDTSFDWWAHVGTETERYRSTVLAGSSQQHYSENFFVNPANNFELTTVNRTNDQAYLGPVDARMNWWGYPGIPSVAAGRIRDKEDYSYLIPVDYSPVMETNTSLLHGSCPPGWFHAGRNEPNRILSCFLFVGGVMPYSQAESFCQDNGGFMPYFQNSDPRMPSLIKELRNINARLNDGYSSTVTQNDEVFIWLDGVMIPPQQCGFLGSDSGQVGYHNCELMLPFVCEKGQGVASHWYILSPGGICAIVLVIILFLAVFICLLFWCAKSRARKRQYFERKNSLRDSLRSIRAAQEKAAKEQERAATYDKFPRTNSGEIIGGQSEKFPLPPIGNISFPQFYQKPGYPVPPTQLQPHGDAAVSSPDLIGNAHARMVRGGGENLDAYSNSSATYANGSFVNDSSSSHTKYSYSESTYATPSYTTDSISQQNQRNARLEPVNKRRSSSNQRSGKYGTSANKNGSKSTISHCLTAESAYRSDYSSPTEETLESDTGSGGSVCTYSTYSNGGAAAAKLRSVPPPRIPESGPGSDKKQTLNTSSATSGFDSRNYSSSGIEIIKQTQPGKDSPNTKTSIPSLYQQNYPEQSRNQGLKPKSNLINSQNPDPPYGIQQNGPIQTINSGDTGGYNRQRPTSNEPVNLRRDIQRTNGSGQMSREIPLPPSMGRRSSIISDGSVSSASTSISGSGSCRSSCSTDISSVCSCRGVSCDPNGTLATTCSCGGPTTARSSTCTLLQQSLSHKGSQNQSVTDKRHNRKPVLTSFKPETRTETGTQAERSDSRSQHLALLKSDGRQSASSTQSGSSERQFHRPTASPALDSGIQNSSTPYYTPSTPSGVSQQREHRPSQVRPPLFSAPTMPRAENLSGSSGRGSDKSSDSNSQTVRTAKIRSTRRPRPISSGASLAPAKLPDVRDRAADDNLRPGETSNFNQARPLPVPSVSYNSLLAPTQRDFADPTSSINGLNFGQVNRPQRQAPGPPKRSVAADRDAVRRKLPMETSM